MVKMLNKSTKTFTVWSDEVEGRIDPFFYDPEIVRLLEKLKNKKTYKLGELMSDISGGATPRVTEDFYLEGGGIPFLRVQNITEEGIQLDDVKFVKPEVHENQLKRSQLKAGDVVFTITGRIGSVAVVPEDFEGNINQHSVRFHLKDEIDGVRISPEYIAIFFNTDFGRAMSLRNITGGTRPALDYVALKNLDVPLPSTAIQEKVIDKVKKVYEEKRKKEGEVKKILASIDNFVLGELGIDMPEGGAEKVFQIWSNEIEGRIDPFFYKPYFKTLQSTIESKDFAALGELVEFAIETWDQESVFNDQFPYIEISNIDTSSGKIVKTDLISVAEAPSRAKMIAREGDVIVSTTRPGRGAIAQIAKEQDGFIASTGFAILRNMKNAKILKDYLFVALRTSLSLRQMEQRATGGNYPAITTEDLRKIKIVVPEIKTQEKIVAGVKMIYEKAKRLRQEAENIVADAQRQVEQMILG